jgi:hypothetical protein
MTIFVFALVSLLMEPQMFLGQYSYLLTPVLLCIASHKMYVEELGFVKGVKPRTFELEFELESTYRGSYEKLDCFWTWNLEIQCV